MKSNLTDNVRRLEAWEKVTGMARYCGDDAEPDCLSARVLTSPHAHALINAIDTSAAQNMPGVLAVVTGQDYPVLTGVLMEDRPPLAWEKVRYAGEAVAMVVARDEAAASAAAEAIRVDYTPLPAVLNPTQAIAPGAPVLHENLASYKRMVKDVRPQFGTNIASVYKVRKGDATGVMAGCDVVARGRYTLPPTDHLAMEVRTSRASITPDGCVQVLTASQAPYTVQEQISLYFGVPMGRVRVSVPYVGGAFGGKAPVTLELLAYMASKAVGGKPVRVVLTREQDIETAPCRMGLEAEISLGASRDGRLMAAEMTYRVDCGAYADIAPNMAKGIASGCTGPYAVENVSCDAFCVYTNHTYATSYRGFGHESYTFCIERAMDTLADALGMDPWALRSLNALKPGDTSPTQVAVTRGNLGDLGACLEKVKALSGWDEGRVVCTDEHTVRAKGLACLWKEATPPPNAVSGTLLTFNGDGSVNMNVGVVEMGNGSQTRLAHMLATKLKMDIGMIHVPSEVDTRTHPKHWKTVASLSEFLAGHALMRAAEDVLAQIRAIAAQALHCAPEDVEICDAKAFKRVNPAEYFDFKELVHGYVAPDGSTMGDPVIGRGGYMLKGITPMEPDTGRGNTGPAWTVGSQAVEVELDTRDYTYRILNASTVMDVGAVISPKTTAGMIAGGMAMGLGIAAREGFVYDERGVRLTPNMRTYKLAHIGEDPEYRVDFVATPQSDAPFGLRSYEEHGIVGAPAALGNALSAALGMEVNALPATAEALWRMKGGIS